MSCPWVLGLQFWASPICTAPVFCSLDIKPNRRVGLLVSWLSWYFFFSSLSPSVSVQPGNTSATVTGQGPQPNIDLNVSLLEYWPGCNTLLVTVAPSCLLVNHSGLDIVVMTTEEDGDWWEVANGSVLAPPKFQVINCTSAICCRKFWSISIL